MDSSICLAIFPFGLTIILEVFEFNKLILVYLYRLQQINIKNGDDCHLNHNPQLNLQIKHYFRNDAKMTSPLNL